MKADVQKQCTKLGLADKDFTYIDVEVELAGTKEKAPKFGDFLYNLSFEDGKDVPAANTAAAAKPAGKRNLADPAPANNAAGPAPETKELKKLQQAPYALVMKGQQGYRVSGHEMAKELCYQANQFKKLAEKANNAQ